MKAFGYVRPSDVAEAVDAVTSLPGATFLGGGTNLVDLMREGVAAPETLVDVTGLGLTGIEELPDGGLRIGSGVRNSDLASHPVVRRSYPVLSQALLMGASGQLRNMATVGGNLLQRTRCLYFYDGAAPCNKRSPGTGCGAAGGFNRMGAILGASSSCVAVNPSDMCVALTMLDAVVEVQGSHGIRRIPMSEVHRLPGDTPDVDTTIARDELITAVELPVLPLATSSRYRKVRDRASYAFALVSVAAALEVSDGAVRQARVALGGVAHKPWRARLLEEALVGAPATDEAFRAAADVELAAAAPGPATEFKVVLARNTVVAVLRQLRDQGGAA